MGNSYNLRGSWGRVPTASHGVLVWVAAAQGSFLILMDSSGLSKPETLHGYTGGGEGNEARVK